MGVIVYLGNHQTIDRIPVKDADGNHTGEHNIVDIPGKNRTEYAPPAEWSVADIVTDLARTWSVAHSPAPPAWVASTDPQLAVVLGAAFGCPVREVDLDHQPDTDTPTEG